MSTEDFSRVQTMSGRELVVWAFILARAEDIEARLSPHGPDARLAEAQAALKQEIEKRTAEGTG